MRATVKECAGYTPAHMSQTVPISGKSKVLREFSKVLSVFSKVLSVFSSLAENVQTVPLYGTHDWKNGGGAYCKNSFGL